MKVYTVNIDHYRTVLDSSNTVGVFSTESDAKRAAENSKKEGCDCNVYITVATVIEGVENAKKRLESM